MSQAIPGNSVLYIRYKDHVLFRNIAKPIRDAIERETVGWLFREDKELICLQHDRTIESPKHAKGKASGLLILKDCILEIREIPLQKISRGPLNRSNAKITNAESALTKAKRKTQPK